MRITAHASKTYHNPKNRRILYNPNLFVLVFSLLFIFYTTEMLQTAHDKTWKITKLRITSAIFIWMPKGQMMVHFKA